jgi:allantoinase
MTLHAISSRRVVTPQGIRRAAILIEDGVIRDLVPPERVPANCSVSDFGEAAILPGLVDSHVHINEPGRTEWEGFETATKAAAAGGYTMLVDMPLNCTPATTTVAALEEKRRCARATACVDWAFWGGVVNDNQQDIEPLADAGVAGFKCFLIHPGIDEFTMVTEGQLRAALPHVVRTGLPLLVHAELPGPVESATSLIVGEDWRRYETYLRSRPDEAELAAIELLLSLCREFRFHLHIVHLASARALPRLRAAKEAGLPITVETCPHYLHFASEDIPDGATLFKCAPPIRNRRNREFLWDALREGLIDLIATDHSPCPPSLKNLHQGDFRTAWGGIASLSVALPVIWTQASNRGFTLGEIAKWMAAAPAQLACCAKRKGKLAPGYDADFVVFEPESKFVVTPAILYSRHKISPYLGQNLSGKVLATFVRGIRVYADGDFPATPTGRECLAHSSSTSQL